MTPRSAMPTDVEVQQAIATLTELTGKAPSTLALAQHLGIANTTFRRQFPHLPVHLSRARRSEGSDPGRSSSPFDHLKNENTQLRRQIEDLNTHLELAVANIQRLTLDNHRLRQERDEAFRVTSITRARQQHKPRSGQRRS